MTELIQQKYTTFSSIINKLDITTAVFNKGLILKDIEKFENATKKAKAYNKINIRALVDYLKKILNNLDDNITLELAWNLDDNELLKSYPMNLIYEGLYGLNTCNYIEVDPGNKIVDIDTLELANIIAFEFMHRDLGCTHRDIEEALSDCGVTAVEDSSVLVDYMKQIYTESSMYELSKEYKISDSPYYIREDNIIQDYFGIKTFKADKYRDVIKYSCEYANSVISSNIFKEANKLNLDMRILTLGPTRIQFMIKDYTNEKIRDILVGDIVIRVFGRKFRLSNKINVY